MTNDLLSLTLCSTGTVKQIALLMYRYLTSMCYCTVMFLLHILLLPSKFTVRLMKAVIIYFHHELINSSCTVTNIIIDMYYQDQLYCNQYYHRLILSRLLQGLQKITVVNEQA